MGRMPVKETREVKLVLFSKICFTFILPGPLVTMEPGDYYSQIGVVSWGIGCANPSFPGVYSRVTEVNTFLQDNMRGATCSPPNVA